MHWLRVEKGNPASIIYYLYNCGSESLELIIGSYALFRLFLWHIDCAQ